MNPLSPLIEFKTKRGEPFLFFVRDPAPPLRFAKLCLDAQFSFGQIALKLNLSSSTLRKSFTQYAGISPKQWMAQHRVILSLRMIRQGISLGEVADTMGYHDYSHMAKEFKTMVSHTPKQMKICLETLQKTA